MLRCITWVILSIFFVAGNISFTAITMNDPLTESNLKIAILCVFLPDFPFNFCPGYVDNHGDWVYSFYCRISVRLYGLHHVYCCGNDTFRYCCRDKDRYYADATQYSTSWLYWNQMWVSLIADMRIYLYFW